MKDKKGQHVCPECNTQNSMSIIGTRVSTLNSITTSQILSSDLDERDEKYRKVLAFTNGVQDAAHQSGFIEARNYRFTFRTSLQKVINEQDGPISIDELTKKFIDYWKSNSDPSESIIEKHTSTDSSPLITWVKRRLRITEILQLIKFQKDLKKSSILEFLGK